MASNSPEKDFNVQKLSKEEGERLFLMELSKVCYVPETEFKFIRKDVARQLLLGGALSRNLNLRTYMIQIYSKPSTAFDTIIEKYSYLFPFLELNKTIYLPIRTKSEIQSYLDYGIADIRTYNIIDLAEAFLESELILIRSIFVNFENMRKNGASKVKSKLIKNVISEIPKLFVCMYGFGLTERIILETHRDVFILKKDNGPKGAAYVSLIPGFNFEKYLQGMILAKGQKLEKVLVKYLVCEMRKLASESGIIFGDEIAKIIDEIPEKLTKYGGGVKKIIFKYRTIFQPISKNSKRKDVLQFAYYLPCDEKIEETLNLDSSKLSKMIPREIPPKDVQKLHEHFLHKSMCLEHIYKNMLPQIDSQFTLIEFENYLKTRAKKPVKTLVLSFGTEEFLKIHLNIFPVKSDTQNLYGRVSQNEFNSYLVNKERTIFSDEIKKLAEVNKKPRMVADTLKVTASQNVEKEASQNEFNYLVNKERTISNDGINKLAEADKKPRNIIDSLLVTASQNVQKQASQNEFNYLLNKQRTIFSDGIKKLAEADKKLKSIVDSLKVTASPNVEKEALKYLVSEIRKVSGECGIIFISNINQIIDDIPEKFQSEISSKYGDISNFILKYSEIFKPIYSLKEPKSVCSYFLPHDKIIDDILNNLSEMVQSGVAKKLSINVEQIQFPPKSRKILNIKQNQPAPKVTKKLNTCSKLEYTLLDHINVHLLPNMEEQFTLAQFRKCVKTLLVLKKEIRFIQNLGYENFLKRHLKIFPVQLKNDGSKLYCRVSQNKFMDYILKLKLKSCTVSSDEKKELTQLVPKAKSVVKYQFTFNECIYMDQNESYIDFMGSLLQNQPDQELRFLTLQYQSNSINREVQTHSSGLVSSMFLYPI